MEEYYKSEKLQCFLSEESLYIGGISYDLQDIKNAYVAKNRLLNVVTIQLWGCGLISLTLWWLISGWWFLAVGLICIVSDVLFVHRLRWLQLILPNSHAKYFLNLSHDKTASLHDLSKAINLARKEG